MPPRWTTKREMFLREYISNGFNATAAARAVGYAHPNVAGPRLVNVSSFQDRLAELCAEANITREEVTARLARIARSGIAEFWRLSADGQGIEVDWDKVLKGEYRDVIKAIKSGTGGTEIKGFDRLRALEMLGRSMGMFVDRVVQEHDERPISQAVLQQAVDSLRAFEREKERVVRGWRETTGPSQ